MAHQDVRPLAGSTAPVDPRGAFARGMLRRSDGGWLAPLLLMFIAKGLLLVAIVAPFTGHDEVDHFYYIARLAHGGGLGEIGAVRLPPQADRFGNYVADYPYNAEVIQPPLYHLLLVPVYWLVPGDDVARLYVLRMVSVALGLVVVVLAYLTAELLFPDDFLIRAGVPLFVALQPQVAFEAAIVNHDILVIALSSLLLYLLLRWSRDGFTQRRQIILALLAGAGLWTKVSFGLALPVIAIALARQWRHERGPLRGLIARLARTCLLPLLIASPWFIRSLRLYGDPTGASRLHDIPGYGDQASTYRGMLFSSVFWRSRLEDFWGNYGWRLVPFDPGTYHLIYLLWGIADLGLLILVGRGVWALAHHRPSPCSRFQWYGLALTAVWLVLLAYGVLYVGTIQFTQSRFAFPGAIGFGLLTVVGLAQWLPRRARGALVLLLLIALVALNVVTAVRFLIPFYYGANGATVITR